MKKLHATLDLPAVSAIFVGIGRFMQEYMDERGMLTYANGRNAATASKLKYAVEIEETVDEEFTYAMAGQGVL
jgi:hypothetical protein